MLHHDLETGGVASQRSSASLRRTISREIVRMLPAAAFVSRRFQTEEDAAIWTRSWVCVGFDHDIPNAGDVLPFTVGNHGIHIERLADGSLAGRFNKAQHGGCRTVPLQCQTGTKTKCSFTACGYSRDRGPIAADAANRDAALDQYFGLRPERLLPVPVKVWGPLLLVQLDPEAKHAFAWPEPDAIVDGALKSDDISAARTRWIEYDANWKHLAACLAEGSMTTSGPDHAISGLPTSTEVQRNVVLFPNVVIRAAGDNVAVVVLQPTALGRTLCRVRAFGQGPLSEETEQQVHGAIGAAAAVAETLQRIDDGDNLVSSGDSDAMRSWFEGKVLDAVEAFHAETLTGPLFQTQDKGGW